MRGHQVPARYRAATRVDEVPPRVFPEALVDVQPTNADGALCLTADVSSAQDVSAGLPS